jgi:hypothetical protein
VGVVVDGEKAQAVEIDTDHRHPGQRTPSLATSGEISVGAVDE